VSDAPAGASGSRKPARFLIVRLGSLGDIIHAIPAAAALRAALPSAQIDWAVDPRYVDLIKMVTAVNHPVPLDPRAGVVRLFAIMGELRRRKYKVAIDFQGLVKSATIARFAGAERVVGFPQAHLRESAARAFYTDAPETIRAAHVVYKNLELVSALGIDYANWLLNDRNLQNVSDHAALAGDRLRLSRAGRAGRSAGSVGSPAPGPPLRREAHPGERRALRALRRLPVERRHLRLPRHDLSRCPGAPPARPRPRPRRDRRRS